MAEDVEGWPYSGGADHGDADDEFATVVFDEAFVRSAAVHEPSARERRLAAAETRFDPDTALLGRGREPAAVEGLPLELWPQPVGLDDDRFYPDPWSGSGRARRRTARARRVRYDPLRAPRGRYVAQQRWHRPIAWVLAVVMGAGVLAVAVAAVYRGVGSGSPAHPAPGSSSATPAAARPKAGGSPAVPPRSVRSAVQSVPR